MKHVEFRFDGLTEYTDTAIVDEIKRVASLVHPRPMTIAAFRNHANVGISTVRRHFGTWRNALAASGLGHLVNNSIPITDKMIAQRGKGQSDDDLLSMLRDVALKTGKQTFTMEDFNQNAPINAFTISRRFHGWGVALHRAGLKPANIQLRYSDDECFENLLRVWTHYGRAPKYEEMPRLPSTISTTAYVNRWGTWRKTLKAFVDRINQDAQGSKQEGISIERSKSQLCPIDDKPKSTMAESEERAVKLGVRYLVLKRDHFRCVVCGRSPATHIGLELHVDHITPFSQGGRSTMDNLRATCNECNLGKGAKIE